MPPKPKFTREQIIDSAYEILREEGIDAVVARNVGKKLGTTSSPIFTVFSGMEELKEELYQKAKDVCLKYIGQAVNYEPAFKEFGRRCVLFAQKEPHIYSFLFKKRLLTIDTMSIAEKEYSDIVLPILSGVGKAFDLTIEEVRLILERLFVYCNGIMTLTLNGRKAYSEQKVNEILGENFAGMVILFKLKKGKLDLEFARRFSAGTNIVPKRVR